MRIVRQKRWIYSAIITVALVGCVREAKQESVEYVVAAANVPGNITIDGVLNEPAWQKSDGVWLSENRTGASVSDSAMMTSVKTCYDANNLYIGFVCHDPDIWGTLLNHDDHLWTEEAVEVFIDVDDEKRTYVEIEVSPRNVLFDSFIVDTLDIDFSATKRFDLPDITTAVSVRGTLDNRDDTDGAWTVEISIPFVNLLDAADKIHPGKTKWKVNFYRIDQSNDKESGYAWSPTGARFHKPSRFGTLVFKK